MTPQTELFTRASVPPSLSDLYLKGCEDCTLSEQSRPVKMRGNWNARVFLGGEAPGKIEEANNCTFIGPAGELLKEALQELGLNIDKDFLIGNMTQCRPHPPAGSKKENRAPTAAEISACRYHLETIVEAHNPDLIVLIGGIAASSIMKNYPGAVGRAVNKFYGPDGHNLSVEADLYVVWHPAYILRNMTDRPKWMRQLTKLRDYMLGRQLVQ